MQLSLSDMSNLLCTKEGWQGVNSKTENGSVQAGVNLELRYQRQLDQCWQAR